jgi:nitric oxide dioxygenase
MNVKNLIEYHDGILSKEILKTTNIEITLFCLGKGTEISEHTSTKEGFVYVLDGRGMFTLKGDSIEMVPGVLIHMERDSPHSIRAGENTAFLLTLVARASA